MKHTIAIIAPTGGDEVELTRPDIKQDINVCFQDYDATYFERILSIGKAGDFEMTSPAIILDHLFSFIAKHHATGIFSADDYPGSLYTSVIAAQEKWPGPHPTRILQCSHKYLSRKLQQQSVPEAVPAYKLLDPKDISDLHTLLSYPLFVKPVKSYFSVKARIVNSADELHDWMAQGGIPAEFLYQFNWFLRHYGACEVDGSGFIAEEVLTGYQVTVEGCIYQNNVLMFGIVDSIMYPNTMSFERFQYPSSLADDVQQRMIRIATKFVQDSGLNDTLFNIEMMYNSLADTIHIIEVNPRMAQQFADLYEKVDGTNTYTVALHIAAGRKPMFTHRKGLHKVSASFVLRSFRDYLVIKKPTPDHIARIKREIPDARITICADEGKPLSYFLQDGASYRYLLIHVGARDEQELMEKKEFCLRNLPFKFTTQG